MKPIRGEGISLKQAAKRMYISYSTITYMKRHGLLPFEPIQVSPRKTIVDSADVDDHLATIRTVSGQKLWKQFLEKYANKPQKGGVAGKN
jgi:hypothetical protein